MSEEEQTPETQMEKSLPPVTQTIKPEDYIADNLPPIYLEDDIDEKNPIDDPNQLGCRGTVTWAKEWSNYSFHKVIIDSTEDIIITEDNFCWSELILINDIQVTLIDCNLCNAVWPESFKLTNCNIFNGRTI